MIIVLAKVTVKEGKKGELLALAKPLLAATRQEEGCVSYALLDDPFDPQSMRFVEQWKDKQALEQHLTTPHVREWREKQKDLLAAPTAIQRYEGQEA